MKDKKNRSVPFIIVSIVLHGLLFVFFINYQASNWMKTQVTQEVEPSITFLDVADLDARFKGQVVEQDESKSEDVKKDTKFLGKNNKQVKKETRAAKRGEFKNSKNTQETKKSKQASQQASVTPQTTPKPREEQNYKTFQSGDMAVNEEDVQQADTFQALRPNNMQQQMAKSVPVAVSQSNDYLKDTDIGAETHLNTREFLYFTYFNRIKKRLRKYWEPLIHQKVRHLLRTGRNPASYGNKVTRLIITMNKKGTLTRVQVVTASGLEDLDDAAIEAFRAAAPFPNPPDDLIKNGFVKINWDFVLES